MWNCGRVNLEPTYLLDFVDDPDEKGSYTASLGIRETYKCLLGSYRFLSAREVQGAKIIKELVQRLQRWF